MECRSHDSAVGNGTEEVMVVSYPNGTLAWVNTRAYNIQMELL